MQKQNANAFTVEDLKGYEGFVMFWRPKDENGYLGNWWESPFELNGKVYICSEQYMMEQKALLMGDEVRARDIMNTGDPARMKKLGQQVKPWDEERWLANRCRIMYEGCMAKFRAHPDLRRQLLSTGHAILVEASPLDRIWGIGLKASDPLARKVGSWKGLNLLGRVLMKVREDLETP